MDALLRRCGLACVVALVAAAAAPGAFAATKSVPGTSIARELRAGHAFVEDDLTVRGPLDLTGVEVVRRVFKCRKCTFRGPVRAPDVTFERTLDLSGSTFRGEVDFRGATLRGPALFRALVETEQGEDQPVTFKGPADFSLAVFDDFASYGGSEFEQAVAFRDTRFSDGTFASTIFHGTAAFDRAAFRGAALFNSAEFKDAASFEEAGFQKRTDFSLAIFDAGGFFSGAQFANGASFLATQFFAGAEEAARFDDVAASGDLDFTFASFTPKGSGPNVVAAFSHLVCSQSVVFRDTSFPEDADLEITMDQLQVANLILDVDVVSQIQDDESDENQRAVLRSIENSAKARDDLATANDAHYELRVLRSKDFGPVLRGLDYVFYRQIAGYLVRPARPLALLLTLATALAVIRVVRTRAEPASQRPSRRRVSRTRRIWRGTRRRCADFLTCFLDKLAMAGPRWGGDKSALGTRLEIIAYRLLLVCAVLGLANSNPTLRQMVDTLF
jgi:hypothetical protein